MTSRAIAQAEALQLLGSVTFGRIVFTQNALPTIQPVHHIVDRGAVVVRGHRGVDELLKAVAGNVVAYSADMIDPLTYVGWSVTLTGIAQLIDDPAETVRYPSVVRPWGAHEQGYVIRIRPEVIAGFELLERREELPAGTPVP